MTSRCVSQLKPDAVVEEVSAAAAAAGLIHFTVNRNLLAKVCPRSRLARFLLSVVVLMSTLSVVEITGDVWKRGG